MNCCKIRQSRLLNADLPADSAPISIPSRNFPEKSPKSLQLALPLIITKMSKSTTKTMASPSSLANKRKRDTNPDSSDDEGKLEIDVNLPEPPSKKAKRKEKKEKEKKVKPAKVDSDGEEIPAKPAVAASATTTAPVRSAHGIWIGNLPYSTTSSSLREFFLNVGGISETDIFRVNLPLNERKQNKGFAYVDFSTSAVQEIALSLSEKLIQGRACLIKKADSFAGRPAVSAAAEAAKVQEKEPSKRVFVGNLGFDTTREELGEHFAQAGTVEDVFLATFEDSGKCKGFGWVTFGDLESAGQAVRGYIYKKHVDERGEDGEDDAVEDAVVEGSGDEADEKPKRKPRKPMKWFINRYQGREMKLEFAEDKQTRYKKRYGGKGGAPPTEGVGASRPARTFAGEGGSSRYHDAPGENLADLVREAQDAAPKKRDPKLKKMDKDERQEYRRKRHDARTVAPGKALANAQRSGKASGAIVEGSGTKKTFD